MTTTAQIIEQSHVPMDRETTRVQAVGRVITEALKKQGKLNELQENVGTKYNVATEANELTFGNNAAFYTTAVASFVERLLRPRLLAAGVVRRITDFRMKGFNAIKVPIRDALVTAAALPDSGAVTYDSNDYGSQTITLDWVYAANALTHELLQHAAVDLMAAELGELGDAISRKIDSDIISALQTATTVAGGNSTKLGASTEISFTAFMAGYQATLDNYAEPDTVLMSPESFVTFMQDSDVKSAIIRNSVSPGTVVPLMHEFLGMRILVSQQVDNDDIYLIDTGRCGYFLEGSPVQTFDGRVSGSLAFEVIAAQAYGVAIVQPKAVYRIEENAS